VFRKDGKITGIIDINKLLKTIQNPIKMGCSGPPGNPFLPVLLTFYPPFFVFKKNYRPGWLIGTALALNGLFVHIRVLIDGFYCQ
jgi:hypothetical protein